MYFHSFLYCFIFVFHLAVLLFSHTVFSILICGWPCGIRQAFSVQCYRLNCQLKKCLVSSIELLQVWIEPCHLVVVIVWCDCGDRDDYPSTVLIYISSTVCSIWVVNWSKETIFAVTLAGTLTPPISILFFIISSYQKHFFCDVIDGVKWPATFRLGLPDDIVVNPAILSLYHQVLNENFRCYCAVFSKWKSSPKSYRFFFILVIVDLF